MSHQSITNANCAKGGGTKWINIRRSTSNRLEDSLLNRARNGDSEPLAMMIEAGSLLTANLASR